MPNELDIWIESIETDLIPVLEGDRRFANHQKLVRGFRQKVAACRSRPSEIKQIIEIVNELAAAERLLAQMSADEALDYEPSMADTQRRIDFRISNPADEFGWIKIKSISPSWVNDEAGWQRYERLVQNFPPNARLAVGRGGQGAALASQAIKTKYSMLARTAEMEERTALIPVAQRGRVWVLFCSNGFDWHLDELEDFADFYRHGRPSQDDWSANLMAQYMEENNIVFRRTLDGFIYLERPRRNVHAREFRLDVRGPLLGMAGREEG